MPKRRAKCQGDSERRWCFKQWGVDLIAPAAGEARKPALGMGEAGTAGLSSLVSPWE